MGPAAAVRDAAASGAALAETPGADKVAVLLVDGVVRVALAGTVDDAADADGVMAALADGAGTVMRMASGRICWVMRCGSDWLAGAKP